MGDSMDGLVSEPVETHGPEKWCAALETWAKALRDSGDEGAWEAYREIRGRLSKSSLGRRLFYEGEKLRTEKCPVHKGRWSGMFGAVPPGCKCMRFDGDEATGWIPGPESDPAKSANPVMLVTLKPNGMAVPANPAIEPFQMKPTEPRP